MYIIIWRFSASIRPTNGGNEAVIRIIGNKENIALGYESLQQGMLRQSVTTMHQRSSERAGPDMHSMKET